MINYRKKNTGSSPSRFRRRIPRYLIITPIVILAGLIILPTIFTVALRHEQNQGTIDKAAQFPVTVDPKNKIIVEDVQVEAFLEGIGAPLSQNETEGGNVVWRQIKKIAETLAETSWYQNLASVSALNGRVVTIRPGLRKEQVADLFAKALSWNSAQKKQFLTAASSASLPLIEGSFFPGAYFVANGTSPAEVQALVNKRFTENVLAHYGPSIHQLVPLEEALTIASIIQRETIGNEDVRLISGILWNRLFSNMNLQIDSTLQYAKANNTAIKEWWPRVNPKDKYIRSLYNTYMHRGLPPTPIANPSVAAILAALNPIKTPCLYYFNDRRGDFHCSETYTGHVALLKRYYGQGK